MSLYSGYAPVVGPHNPGAFFSHFGSIVAPGSNSHTHSLLTQGNLANNNNNGNHTSTSISESQSAATKGVTVGGKRRHNSASDGHLSASSSKGLEPGDSRIFLRVYVYEIRFLCIRMAVQESSASV